MWYLIEWYKWDAFVNNGDFIGDSIEQPEIHEKDWKKTLKIFNELVENDDCTACYVTAMWGDKPYADGDPILTYCP